MPARPSTDRRKVGNHWTQHATVNLWRVLMLSVLGTALLMILVELQ